MRIAITYRPNPTTTALLAGLCVALTGCSLERYVERADREVHSLVEEKSNDPRWGLPCFTIAQDPRSRYYDTCNEIRPPMPPDDPASHEYMERVDKKKGSHFWYRNGCRADLENPWWYQQLGDYVPLTAEGKAELSVDSAVQVALVNSPDFQRELEDIYLSALDVSTERFRFDVQFFGGNLTRYTHLGRERSAGDADRVVAGENNVLRTDTDFELTRRFATAGELAVGFANSFVWQFAGPDSEDVLSILNFTLAQPLLRRAGRVVAMEQLTLAERTLLANLRAFAQYRQGFYTQVAIGQLGVSGPQRVGGFFGGTGLTGFTGTGAGGFGGVGEATNFGRTVTSGGGGSTASGGFAGGGAGQVGGFIGLLQQLQQIRNREESLAVRLRTLRLLEAHLDAGTIDLQQVDQFRQAIETERANLLQAKNDLADSLDSFLSGTLGLPPNVPVELDTSLIKPFEFIDPTVTELQQGISEFRESFGDLQEVPPLGTLQSAVAQLDKLGGATRQHLGNVKQDLDKFQQSLAERKKTLSARDAEQLDKDLQRLIAAFAELQARVANASQAVDQLEALLAEETRQASSDRIINIASELALVADELSLVQARARLEVITVDPVDLDPECALAIARANRLDWMNNRAAVVDTWRLIAFNANALKSDLNLVFSGDVRTTRDNPFKFRGPTGRLSVGVELDGPFSRRLERNNFRQILIDYQRDRRQLIEFEDGVHRSVRSLLRQLDENRQNLEIQRRAVAIAIRRVDQSREVLNKPPEGENAQLGPTAAINLISALSDLRGAQDNFMSVWLNYLAVRMTLMRELGVMVIDEQGLWVDLPLDRCGLEPIADGEELAVPPPVPEPLLPLLDDQETDLATPPDIATPQESDDPAPLPPPLP